MKIDVLSSKLTWENEQVVNELSKRGVDSSFIDPRKMSYVADNGIELYYDGVGYEMPDCVLLRGGFVRIMDNEGRLLLNTLELMGTIILDQIKVVHHDKDKFYQSVVLKQNGIPHPKTLFINREIEGKLDFSPVIVKPNQGSKGKGIRKLEKFVFDENQVMLQGYLASGNSDTRVLVVDGSAVGALRRTAQEGEWRSNVALGGHGEAVDLDVKAKEVAEKAASVLGLYFAGVDLIFDNGMYYVIEVNRAPQFRAFSEITGINVAGLLADNLINVVKNQS